MGFIADCFGGLAPWSDGGWIWMGLMMFFGPALTAVFLYAAFKYVSHGSALGNCA